MTGWALVFLGTIAAAVVVMAVIQVGAIIYMARLAQRVDELTTRVEQELAPLLASLADVAQSASRAASVAVAQVDRFDRLCAELSGRIQETMIQVQNVILAPAREGAALIGAIKTAIDALRGPRPNRPRAAGVEEEDALFIG